MAVPKARGLQYTMEEVSQMSTFVLLYTCIRRKLLQATPIGTCYICIPESGSFPLPEMCDEENDLGGLFLNSVLL